MAQWMAGNDLAHTLSAGVLADQALLVVSEYIQERTLSSDAQGTLDQLRTYLSDAEKRELARSVIGPVRADSLPVHEGAAAETERLVGRDLGGEEITLDDMLRVINALLGEALPEPEEVRPLEAFLSRWSEHTLQQEAQILSDPGRLWFDPL